MTGTLSDTTAAKAKVFVGSDASIQVVGMPQAPPHSTLIERTTAYVGATPVDLLGVDPRTFAAVAFWDDRFSDHSLQTLMNDLATGRPGAAITVGLPAQPRLTLAVGASSGRGPSVTPIATAQTFPGLYQAALVVVARGYLDAQDVPAITQLWIRGGARTIGAVTEALARHDVVAQPPITAAAVSQAPNLIAIQWTFDFVDAVGVFAAALALAGLHLSLNARQRARQVS